MQVDDRAAAGRLVQAVHVLRDQQFDAAFVFQPRQRQMRCVGPHLAEAAPAYHAARPVARAGQAGAHEGLEVDGRLALPLALAVAVVGNARGGAAARAGQDKQAMVAVDESPQGIDLPRQDVHARRPRCHAAAAADARRGSRTGRCTAAEIRPMAMDSSQTAS